MPLEHKALKRKKPMTLPWWGVLCWMIGVAPVVWLLSRMGRFELLRPTVDAIGVLGATITMRWYLRRHLWFWITMMVMAALHVPVILFIPWSTKWVPVMLVMPLAIADVYAMLALVGAVGSFVERRAEHEQ